MTNLTTMNQTMSSGEIAELTGKEKKAIHRDIKEQLLSNLYGKDGADLYHEQIQGLTFILDERGYWKEVHLDRYHTDILVSGYEVKYRAAIIKRWHELEQATQVIANNLGMTKKELLEDIKLDTKIEAERVKQAALKDKAKASQLKLQALKDKLAKQKQVLDARTTKLLAQGAKVKGDMIASKLDLPVDTITNLLKAHGSKLKPSEANNALVNLGYLESTKDKTTMEGNYYGRTLVSSKSTHTTLARWFPAEFESLLEQINQYYLDREQGLE